MANSAEKPFASGTSGDFQRLDMLRRRAHWVDASVEAAAVDVWLAFSGDETLEADTRALLTTASEHGTNSPQAAQAVHDFLSTPFGAVVGDMVKRSMVLLSNLDSPDEYFATATAAVMADYAARERIEPDNGRLTTSSIAHYTACAFKAQIRGAREAAEAECAPRAVELAMGPQRRPSSLERADTATQGRSPGQPRAS